MRLFGFLPVVARRTVVALGVAGMMFVGASTAQAQDAAQAPDPFKFNSAQPAMIMIQIKPGTEATFEGVVAELKTKMAASEKAEVVAQGKTLNLVKADLQIPEGQAPVYLIYLDAPTGASYNIEAILTEIGEWRQDSELYTKFVAAIHQWAPWPLVRK